MRRNRSAIRVRQILGLALLSTIGAVHAREDLSRWQLPPAPVPANNPQTPAKIALGHQLAFDTRLSKNHALACASCHVPFAGGGGITPRAFGQAGELGRWAPSWDNSAYYTSLFWDGRASSLEQQTGALPGHMGPLTAPGEMGGTMKEDVATVNAIPGYRKQFRAVFHHDATAENIAQAIASFERTLIATQAPFQRYVAGNRHAISPAAKRGFALFQSKALCTACHVPPALTDNNFHDIGIPQVGPLQQDAGRSAVTKDPTDARRFKTPSLYNAGSFTFLMHDGAYSTLQQVVAHYNRGGNPADKNQDPLIQPLHLTAQEQRDLVAFLQSLTDPHLDAVTRPRLP